MPSTPPSASNSTYSSRRENHSSSSSSRGERSSRAQTNPAVESAVTRLLVSIKQLLEALTLWSKLQMSEAQVSDVYVRLGNDFNAAVAAFGQFNIEMSELMTVPEDLRSVLESCLSEDATEDNLNQYLPKVRKIITNLLQGLRNKQSIYRRLDSDRRQRTGDSQRPERTESRSSRADDRRTRGESVTSSRSHHSRSIAGDENGLKSSPTSSDGQPRRRTGGSRRKDPSFQSQSSIPPQTSEDGYFAGGFIQQRSTLPDEDQTIHANASSRLAAPPMQNGGYPQFNQDNNDATPNESDDPNDRTMTPLTPPVQPPVPPNVTRYSLTDKPMTPFAPPSLVVDEATPPSSSENIASLARSSSAQAAENAPIDTYQAPAMASSLAALKKSDALERRASKRFSTYNISKMTGGSIRDRLGIGKSSNRRSMAADASALTTSELNVLAEVDEEPSKSPARSGSRSKSSERGASRKARMPSPLEEEAPPLPPLPPSSSSPVPDHAPLPPDKPVTPIPSETPKPSADERPPTPPATPGPSLLTVFLQVGRVIKKVTIEPGLSFSSLRVLFVDKFSYSPGQDNFPAIYIRDPSSGVMYELEDVEEVKDKCLLSLNIEPLDQIKQHIDSQMSSLVQEIKELRSTVGQSRRVSYTPAIITEPFGDTPMARPTDGQFQRVARRLSQFVANKEGHLQNAILPQNTGQTLQPQMTGGSVLSEASSRIVVDLKTQFDEVQNLRRDLGVIRQLYTDFMGQTKDSLSTLRTQTQNVRQLANSKVGGARAYIDSGKSKLDSRSQTVLTRVEELQDTVENLKDDVLKRFVSPKSNLLKTVSKDIGDVATELESIKEYINTVKPMWKKTWEEELQNIVEEQQFLSHQEEFLGDLLEDHKALVEVFGHIEKVISIRGATPLKARGFRPPPPEEGHGGLSTVMMEIRGAAVDPERRLKAIAANQKNREKEMASRSDEFEAELQGFVAGKKLKLTGGADEVERVRQRRNDQALKAMFTGGSIGDSLSVNSSADSRFSE
ncbi:AIP3-domain-containing protein [Rickenella mellea]|uniref:AIP3-domain-containing protein n=1 Tax=Rickenella mellea TaxID=50990 RepID=A0A4Y7Q7Z3_9AGAM|nr:AIP3-domain-containing protein [Rickenella mellea]